MSDRDYSIKKLKNVRRVPSSKYRKLQLMEEYVWLLVVLTYEPIKRQAVLAAC